jgi:hypothetical protein
VSDDAKCPRCDRAGCTHAKADWPHASLPSVLLLEIETCIVRAVDWRARALAAESALAREKAAREEEEAGAAAMAEVLGWLRGEIGVFIQNVGYLDAVNRVLDSNPGRTLLARLAAMEGALRAAREETILSGGNPHAPVDADADAVRAEGRLDNIREIIDAALAALSTAGGEGR